MSDGELRDVRVAASPVRCPYCHSDVSPDASDWVACRDCLARHHAACWTEQGACAACGASTSLTETKAGPRARPDPGRPGRALAAVALGLSSFVVVFVTFAALSITAFDRVEHLKSPTPADLTGGNATNVLLALTAGALWAVVGALVLGKRATVASEGSREGETKAPGP